MFIPNGPSARPSADRLKHDILMSHEKGRSALDLTPLTTSYHVTTLLPKSDRGGAIPFALFPEDRCEVDDMSTQAC